MPPMAHKIATFRMTEFLSLTKLILAGFYINKRINWPGHSCLGPFHLYPIKKILLSVLIDPIPPRVNLFFTKNRFHVPTEQLNYHYPKN